MSEPPIEYQIGDIANGYIWTGVEWTRYYHVGEIANGYMWTGHEWVPAEDGPALSPEPAEQPVDPAPLETEPLETEPLESAPLNPEPLESAPLETEPTAAAVTPITAVVGAAAVTSGVATQGTVAPGLPAPTGSDFFTDDEPPPDLSFLDSPSGGVDVQPIYKRWWFWAIAGTLALLAIGAFALSNRTSDDPLPTPTPSSSTSPTGSPSVSPSTSTSPSGTTSATTSASPTDSTSGSATPAPSGTGVAQITARYGTFTPVTKTGTGASVIDLPAGSDYGIVAASATGAGVFAITELAADNTPTGGLLVDTAGPYVGTTAYGLVSVGAKATKLKIDANGPWRITISPLDKAPTLALPAKGVSNSVYIYFGPAQNWKIVHTAKTSTNFSVVQYAQLPNLLVNAIGNYSGTVPATAGPTVITIDASGPWSITAAP